MRDDAVRSRARARRAGAAARAEVARLFLKLGVIGFGGPAAHIALMEDEVVRRRRWLTREQFLDLLGATNLIPGPNSTEMAIHIGFVRAGWPGLVAGGACFILPAMLITLALAVDYARYGRLPEAGWILYGVKPVIIAVVVQARVGPRPEGPRHPARRRRRARRSSSSPCAAPTRSRSCSRRRWACPCSAPSRRAGGARALAPGGALRPRARGRCRARPARRRGHGGRERQSSRSSRSSSSRSARSSSGAATSSWRSSGRTWSSGPAGSPTRSCWTPSRSASSPPGPCSPPRRSSGTSWPGLPGAIVATAAIFLPSFVFVALSSPLVPRLRRSPWAGAFLDGANAASVALMAAVTWELGRAAVVDWLTGALALVAAVVLLRHAAQLRVARRRRRGRRRARPPCSTEQPSGCRQPAQPRPELPRSN